MFEVCTNTSSSEDRFPFEEEEITHNGRNIWSVIQGQMPLTKTLWIAKSCWFCLSKLQKRIIEVMCLFVSLSATCNRTSIRIMRRKHSVFSGAQVAQITWINGGCIYVAPSLTISVVYFRLNAAHTCTVGFCLVYAMQKQHQPCTIYCCVIKQTL